MTRSHPKRSLSWNGALATATAVLALFVSGLLASCGGGENGLSGSEPARAPMSAAAAIAPEEAARQLMDFGESVLPQYFPGHETTLSFAPFVYRHYAATGIYLAVVVSEGTGFLFNGVYVMGGPFGDAPRYVGQLTSFITPTEPGPVSQFNGNYDLRLLITEKIDPCGKDKPIGSTLTFTITISDGVISSNSNPSISGTVSTNGDFSLVIDSDPCPDATVVGVMSASGAAVGSWDKPAGQGELTPHCFIPPGAEDPGSAGCPGYSGTWTATRTN